MMDIDIVEENSRLMDLMQEDLHLMRGLVQKELVRMANKPDRMVVQFRDLNAKKNVFCLELGKHDPYNAIVGRIAKKLHVDPLRIRLTRHDCLINDGPCPNHVKLGGCLLDIVGTGRFDKICNVMYYEVLNEEHLKIMKVSYKCLYEKEISLVLPKHARVEDLLNDIKKVKLTNSNAELRLLGIYYDKRHTVFPLKEKIEDIPEYVKLRAEEIIYDREDKL